MPVFSDYESIEEFKDRLNSLTNKLKNTCPAQVKQKNQVKVVVGIGETPIQKTKKNL